MLLIATPELSGKRTIAPRRLGTNGLKDLVADLDCVLDDERLFVIVALTVACSEMVPVKVSVNETLDRSSENVKVIVFSLEGDDVSFERDDEADGSVDRDSVPVDI